MRPYMTWGPEKQFIVAWYMWKIWPPGAFIGASFWWPDARPSVSKLWIREVMLEFGNLFNGDWTSASVPVFHIILAVKLQLFRIVFESSNSCWISRAWKSMWRNLFKIKQTLPKLHYTTGSSNLIMWNDGKYSVIFQSFGETHSRCGHVGCQ